MQRYAKVPAPSVILLLAFFWTACQQRSENAAHAPVSPTTEVQSNGQAAAPNDQQPRSSAFAVAESAEEQAKKEAPGTDIFSSAAAVPGAIDSLKKFVRTAEMRFRVKNAPEATLRIEDIAKRNGGFVLSSNLKSEVELHQVIPLNRDSSVENTRYTVHSQLIIRVPYRQLDTTLRSIGRLCDFLDLRHVNAEDVGLQMLEKELTRIREGLYRTELDNSPESRNNPKPERARESREATDQARIETLKLEDNIRFSTVQLDIYQLPQIHQAIVANTDFPEYHPPFLYRLKDALRNGIEILTMLFLGVLHLWLLILFGALAFWGIRRWNRK